ncbi:DUF2218 domain-containing protein [uncultured Jannaschia sp.]|uniref:DUF2218 domain-containing protein n=1 Tax=uncultured Jannaschia sp. TaxID=293347 RepID=UPI0026038F5E|nr:DUF2218 domain-containing protein [uncultured Jannaschia sp.]
MKSVTRIKTANASRYLQQLCKHFAHKVETEFDMRSGTCRFDHSTATLAAQESRLDIEIKAEDDEALTRGQSVIWSHLKRFAFREDLGEPVWQKDP